VERRGEVEEVGIWRKGGRGMSCGSVVDRYMQRDRACI
jgi:hypothetical protein